MHGFLAMRGLPGVALSLAVVCWGASGTLAAEEKLSACFDAVGTFLTTNLNAEGTETVGRSLISLTNGGHFFLTDSNQGGSGAFAPFTSGRGAWRCTSDDGGEFHILATVIDFTLATAEFTDQKMARLDYDVTYDKASDSLSGDVSLYFMPLAADPFDTAALKEETRNSVKGVRVKAP